MKFSSQIGNTQFYRRKIVSFVFFVFALLVAFTVTRYILNDDFESLGLTGLVLAGSAIVVVVINSWRNGLYFFLAWLLLEDLARKFLGNNMAVYFAKDFLVAIVYMSFFIAYRRKEKGLQLLRPPFFL